MSTQKPVLNHIIKSRFAPIEIPKLHLTEFLLKSTPPHTKSSPAFTDFATGFSLTQNDVNVGIRTFASALHHSLSVSPSSVFAISIPNTIYYPIITHGSALLGAIPTLCNPGYTSHELAHQLENSDATVLVTTDALLETAKQAIKKATNVRKLILVPTTPIQGGWKRSIEEKKELKDEAKPVTASVTIDEGGIEIYDFLNLMEIGSHSAVLSNLPPTHPVNAVTSTALMPYSSGTTGLQKGVELTHYNLIANILQQHNILHFKSNDNVLGILPFFHMFAHHVILNGALAFGFHTIVLPAFEPAAFLTAIQQYKVTRLFLVPPIFVFLAKHPMVQKFDLTSVNEIFSAAAPMGASLEAQITAQFPKATFRQGYGLSEVSPASHIVPPDQQKPASVGVTLVNMESVVVDPATGHSLGPGESNTGEIWLRGPNVMKGYWKNEEATKNTIDADGWLHTGDIGYYDKDEHFYIVDRLKELIKVKGFQVPPAELEALLLSHPSIADCAIIPRADDRCGEIPVAYVVKKDPKLTAAEVESFVAGKVSDYKKLRGGVRFVEKVTKSASGKILRRLMKEDEAKLEPATVSDASK